MIKKITEEELVLWETLHDPRGFNEIMFSDVDNLTDFDEGGCEIRQYQEAFLGYEYTLAENPELSEQENFELMINAGSIYCFGARKYGKSRVAIILDILQSMLILPGYKTLITSFDAVHIRSVLTSIVPVITRHPIFKPFKDTINNSSPQLITLKNGFQLDGVNQNVASSTVCGDQFFGHHVKKVWHEEGSKTNHVAYTKMVDALSEFGAIIRESGMTDFTKYSPAGKTFYDISKKQYICNLPQMVNPTWNIAKKKDAIKKYNGEHSSNFKIFVRGDIIEDGVSVIDMDRVRKSCYNEKKKIQRFEINKENFDIFKSALVLEPYKGSDKVFMCADIGESAPTEIMIAFLHDGVYKYRYNITAYNLTHKEQIKMMKWIMEELNVHYVGIDYGDGLGRAIGRELADFYGTERIFPYDGSAKIVVGFKKDDKGKQEIDAKGKPIEEREYMSIWSVQRLKKLLYDGKIEIPLDGKLDTQLNSIICTTSGNRLIYDCVADDDHLYDAFKVFACTEWNFEFSNLKPVKKKRFFKGGV